MYKGILRLVVCSAILLIVLAMPVCADDQGTSHTPPELPQVFYGTVTINGQPAPVGTFITAIVQGGGGSLVTTTEGLFGQAGPLGEKLIVQGDIPGGLPITFYVDGESAECLDSGMGGIWQDTYPFASGSVTHLDLRVGSACAAPMAGFSASPVSGNVPRNVRFYDTSLNFPTGWLWEFGDNTTSDLRDPVHTYTIPGDYTVNLTVSNECGSDVLSRPGFITTTSIPPPTAGFTANHSTGPCPLTVQFTDTSLNSPAAWSWEFGDGTSSTLQNPTHTYGTPGTFTVNLTVSNAGGTDTLSKAGYIAARPPPTSPDFSASPTSGTGPLTVSFTGIPDGTRDLWSYSFGDGFTSTSRNPVHTYNTPGKYTVTLTVLKIEGGKLLKSTIVKQDFITVDGGSNPGFLADFTASPVNGPAPLSVAFIDTSTGDPRFRNYNFGDGLTSSLKNPVHTYRTPGSYTVSLTIMKLQGGRIVKNTTTMESLITVGY